MSEQSQYLQALSYNSGMSLHDHIKILEGHLTLYEEAGAIISDANKAHFLVDSVMRGNVWKKYESSIAIWKKSGDTKSYSSLKVSLLEDYKSFIRNKQLITRTTIPNNSKTKNGSAQVAAKATKPAAKKQRFQNQSENKVKGPCFRCKEMGHHIHECPVKAKESNSSDSKNSSSANSSNGGKPSNLDIRTTTWKGLPEESK